MEQDLENQRGHRESRVQNCERRRVLQTQQGTLFSSVCDGAAPGKTAGPPPVGHQNLLVLACVLGDRLFF